MRNSLNVALRTMTAKPSRSLKHTKAPAGAPARALCVFIRILTVSKSLPADRPERWLINHSIGYFFNVASYKPDAEAKPRGFPPSIQQTCHALTRRFAYGTRN